MASTRTVLGVYLKACRPHIFALLLPFVFFTIGALSSTTFAALLFRWIIDVLMEHADNRDAAMTAIALPFTLLLCNYVVMNVTYRIADFALTRGQGIVLRDLTVLAFSRLRRHSLTFFENTFTGSLVASSRRFVRSFETLHDKFIFGIFILSVHLIGTMFALFTVSKLIAFIFIGWTFCFVSMSFLLMKWRRVTDIAESEQDSRVTGVLSDALTNIRSVQANAAGTREDERYGRVAHTAWLTHIRAMDRHAVIYGLQGIMILLIEVPAIYLSLRFWSAGVLSIGDVVLVQGLLVACSRHIWDLGRSMKDCAVAISYANEFVDVLELPVDIEDAPSDARTANMRGEVRFDDVTFTYIPGSTVLSKFSLSLRPGEHVGIVGKSGAGKTTLTKLLLRFVDPQSGSITIGGTDIRAMRLDDLRGAIGFVPQDPILFHRSLRENIAYAKANASLESVEAAARKAHVHDVIAGLPKGYDTLVGERGVKLSGGERQRVLLARVFLQDPSIVLLDEPTSALDSESERIVQENLRALMEGRTTLAIAHRISTVRAMDRIIVVEKGAVLEQGTHEELLAKKGFYAKLWEHQVNGFLPEEE